MFDEQERMNALWDDYFAKDDSIRERYASEVKDMRINDMIEADHQEYMQKVYDAGFGDDDDAYEAYWKRTFERAEQQQN